MMGGSGAEKIELPVVRENPSKDFRKEVLERRGELVSLINDIGFFKARRLANSLGKKYEVSERMIYVDFDWIKGHVKPIDLREISIDLKLGRSKALSEAMNILNMAKDDETKLRAIAMVIAAGRHYREEMEAWGEKPKVADSHNVMVSQQPVIFNLIEKSMEEIKSERPGHKSKTGGNPESPGG